MINEFMTTNYMIFFGEKMAFKIESSGAYLPGEFYEEALDEFILETLQELPVIEEVLS